MNNVCFASSTFCMTIFLLQVPFRCNALTCDVVFFNRFPLVLPPSKIKTQLLHPPTQLLKTPTRCVPAALATSRSALLQVVLQTSSRSVNSKLLKHLKHLCTITTIRPGSHGLFSSLYISDTPPGLQPCEKGRHKWRWHFCSESAVKRQTSGSATAAAQTTEKGREKPSSCCTQSILSSFLFTAC